MPKKRKDMGNRLSPNIIIGVVLSLFIAVALFIRIYLPYNEIFVNGWVKYAGTDNYYYMRLVDNMVRNFPHLMGVDPYLAYPNGESIGSYTFFARLLAAISWAIGLGHPSQRLVDVVSAYVPAVLGAVVIVPIYVLGKALFGRWAGLVSAGLIAILPGEFLGRSILGFTDHHIAEVLFSATAMMFLMLAVKSARDKWGSTKPIAYSVLAGLFFGIYMLTWIGGLLFVFIISLYLVAQFIFDHMRRKRTGYLCAVSAIVLSIAGAMFLPTVRYPFYFVAMAGALLLPVALWGISEMMARRGMRVAFYPAVVLGICAVGVTVFFLANPIWFQTMVGVLKPSGGVTTTIEMQPLLFPSGDFTLALAWGNFGLAFFVSLVALVVLAYNVARHGDNDKALLLVWSIAMLVMCVAQRRFAYYFAVNVALLSGYMLWLALRWFGLAELDAKPVAKKARKEAGYTKAVSVGVVSAIVFLVVFFPVLPSMASEAAHPAYAPSDAWCSSLDWLRENSPEPFGSPDAYYELNPKIGSGYGVLSWWDYGYWIALIAHRIPNANPSQHPEAQAVVASFLTAQDEQSADSMGAKYVIIDADTVTSKFWAVVKYAGQDDSRYFGVYYVSDGSQTQGVLLYYPDYYRTMAVRLYGFDGKAVVPNNVIAMTYGVRKDNQGNAYNFITDAKQFGSYGEAEAFVSSQPIGSWCIVSNSPLVSPIPLDGLADYKVAYESSQMRAFGNSQVSEVKIFERIK